MSSADDRSITSVLGRCTSALDELRQAASSARIEQLERAVSLLEDAVLALQVIRPPVPEATHDAIRSLRERSLGEQILTLQLHESVSEYLRFRERLAISAVGYDGRGAAASARASNSFDGRA